MSDAPTTPLRAVLMVRDPGLAEAARSALEQLAGHVERLGPSAWSDANDEAWPPDLPVDADLAIVEVGTRPRSTLERVRRWTARRPAPAVVLCGPELPAPMLLEAMRAGVGEYLPSPHNSGALLDAVQRQLTRRNRATPSVQAADPVRVVVVFGAVGGAGTSTFAVNLALALAQRDANPLLLDLALNGGGMDALLDLQPRYRLQDLVRSIDRLDGTLLESHLARHDSGLRLLSAANDELESGQILPQHVQRVLDALPDSTRCVVIDAGSVLHQRSRPAFAVADAVVHLVTPTLSALRHARRQARALDLVVDGWRDRTFTALTRHDPDPPITAADVTRALDARVAFTLPEDEAMRRRDATSQGPALAHRNGSYVRAFDRAIATLAPALPLATTPREHTGGPPPLLGWLLPGRATNSGASSLGSTAPRPHSESRAS